MTKQFKLKTFDNINCFDGITLFHSIDKKNYVLFVVSTTQTYQSSTHF